MDRAQPQAAMETFPADPGSVPEARHWVRRILTRWGLDDHRDEIELLTSELATNAVIHARHDFTVCLSYDDGVIRVEVCDPTPEMPHRVHDGAPDALGGRGLVFVERLSTRTGVEPRHPGKAVWFEISGHRRSQLVG